MPDINPSLPTVGQPDSTEEPKVVTALSQLIAAVNDVDSAQIKDGSVTLADMVVGAGGLAQGSFEAEMSSAPAAAASGQIVAYTETFDVSSWFDPTTGKFTPQVAGIYRVGGYVEGQNGVTSGYVAPVLYKNGTLYRLLSKPGYSSSSSVGVGGSGSVPVEANGTTDYFTLGWASSTSNLIASAYFYGELIGRT